ncbi:MAG: DUF72 domain-containing protein [Saprospiraceae bacterium]|nr:DUF72 domain-containing protein [Saprospiraceae bacterium]
MDFGKLPDISQVDFTLPDDPDFNAPFKGSGDEKTLYVGCTGWSMKEWVGKVYPPKTKSGDYLEHYTRQFNTIEHNTTHYRIPDVETVVRWRDKSAEDFRFCPKVPQVISHKGDLGLNDQNIESFCENIGLLESKLGVCFMQLPPRFGPKQMGLLESFFKRWPRHIPLSVELRHPDWFNYTGREVFGLMKDNYIASVITDVAGRRDVLHMHLSTREVLIRFVGNGLVQSDYDRIDAWVERLKSWFNAGLTNVYFFCHEPDNILAPELSAYLVEKAKEHLAVKTRGPIFYEESNNQLSLF